MRRTAVRRPIRLTESKLRQVIRSVINETKQPPPPRYTTGYDSYVDYGGDSRGDFDPAIIDDRINDPQGSEADNDHKRLLDAIMMNSQAEIENFFKEFLELLKDTENEYDENLYGMCFHLIRGLVMDGMPPDMLDDPEYAK